MEKVEKHEYLINGETMVILPHYNEHGHLYSLVSELGQDLVVAQKPMEIINNSCLYYGSSYQGRVEGASHLTKYNRMVPIVVCNRSGIYFFPTQSPKSEACIWFAHEYIKEILSVTAESSSVVLRNKTTVPVQISRAAMESKVNRAAQYRHLMSLQQREMERPLSEMMNLEQAFIMETTGAYSFNEHNPHV
ncbi:competence protein ComK [Pseudalkalibacillus sp. Hm43]|uniref:competence protein ComK n=1 Tax=Pseudalkalibacillus sp. Hm43 TaxID=3450742 RepID=UPI003F42DA0F